MQYKSDVAVLLSIVFCSYNLHTLLTPAGKPVKSPVANAVTVTLLLAQLTICIKNSLNIKNGKSDGITAKKHSSRLLFTDSDTVFPITEKTTIVTRINIVSVICLIFLIVITMQQNGFYCINFIEVNQMKNKPTPVRDFIKGKHFSEAAGSIEMIGNSRVVVETTKKILEYNNDKVRLDLGKYIVAIAGTDLTMNSFSDSIIIVDGIIKALSLE